MPQASNITLTDDQAVVHTFEPVRIGPNQQILKNKAAITAAGESTILYSNTPSSAKSAVLKCNAQLHQPVEVTSTDTGRTTVEDTARFFCNSIVPDSMTAAERITFAFLAGQMVINSITQGYISDGKTLT